MLREAGKHTGTDFITVMKGKHHIRPARTCKNTMRTSDVPFHVPTNPQQRG
jgi:hypothetical protein